MKFNRLFGILFITVFGSAFYSCQSIGSPDITSTPILQSATPTPSIAQDTSDNAPTPTAVQQAAQAITMRISSANNGGSGVLIAKKGTTYLVLTNKHVAGRDTQFQVQTPDGQKHTAKLVPNTQISPKYDLALLQFTSSKQYQLAPLKYAGADGDGISPLSPARNIYTAGFPFDSDKLRFSQGQVSQLSDVPLEDGTQIGYTTNKGQKELRQGMSGGPIIDAGGLVVGINTVGSFPIIPNYTYFDGSKPIAKLAAQYRKANWGIPIHNFLTQVNADILYGYENLPKVQRQVTPTGYMAKLNRETRQQTVRIENSGGNGSGVIVAKQGNTYYVLTAKHVLEAPPTDKQPIKSYAGTKVIAYDQESYDIQPSNIKLASGVDLAVVKFTSNTNYPVAKIGNYNPLKNATVFVGGYPGREKIDSPLWQWQLNPGGIEDKEQGKLQAQDRQSFSNGYDIIYSSISYGGMSGGGVFDTDGRVIGIHGKAEGDKATQLILGQSLGISIQTFLVLAERLQVPKLLKISSNSSANLSKQERDTVIAVRDNVAPPQADSSGEQWLQYGNQLYRIGKGAEAAVAFDKAIAKGREYQLFGNYGKAKALGGINNPQALTAISNAIAAVPVRDRAEYYYLWKYQSLISRELGKYDDALRLIEVAIQLEPSDLKLLADKAGILSRTKRYGEAIKIYDLIISRQGNQSEAYTYSNRGVAKSDLGQKQAAIADYDRAIAINPNSAEAYSNRGVAKSDLGQKQAAIADYDRAIAINPNSAKAYSNRGLAKSNLGQKQAAIADYDRAIAINPNLAEAYSNRGNAKSNLGQKQAAIVDYDRAIAINPNFVEAYYNRGLAKSNLGQKQAAIVDYDRAIAINPNYAAAYSSRGTTKSDLGQKQAAIVDYDRAIAINPNYADAYYNRGNAKSDLGQKQAAIVDYDRAIAINPNYVEAYSNRGLAKSDLGQKQAAIADYDRAIAIDPNYAAAYSNRGIAKSDLGQEQAAIVDYDRAIAIDPNYAAAYSNRGNAKADLGQKQAAIADYDRAIAIDPNYAAAYSNRGNAKYELGQKQAAIVDYDRAIVINPNLAAAYSNRGIAKSDLGQKQAAIADLTTAANLFRQQNRMDLYDLAIGLIQKIKG